MIPYTRTDVCDYRKGLVLAQLKKISNKTIISKEEMVLIKNSETPKDTTLYGNLYDTLFEMEVLTQAEFKRNNILDSKAISVLTSNKKMLIDNIVQEWYSYDYGLFTEKEMRCQLCNRKNIWVHYIRNRINGNELHVGCECVKKFPNIEISSNIHKKRIDLTNKYHEDKRRIEFGDIEIDDPDFIINSEKDFKNFAIMLPLDLHNSISNTIKDLFTIKRNYIKNGGVIDDVKRRYKELIIQYNKLWNEAKLFYQQNKSKKLICKKDMSEWLLINHPQVWEEVATNNSLFDEETLAYAYYNQYVARFLSEFKKHLNNESISIVKVDGDSLLFYVEDQKYRKPLYFKIKNKDFMQSVGRHCLVSSKYKFSSSDLINVHIDINNNTFEALYNRMSKIMYNIGFDIDKGNSSCYFKRISKIIHTSNWSSRTVTSEIGYKKIKVDIFYEKCTPLIFSEDNEIELVFNRWYNFFISQKSKWMSQADKDDLEKESEKTYYSKQKEFV